MDGSEKTSRSSDDSMKNASTPEAVSPTSTSSLVTDGDICLIKVKAQAMAIDESTGLWRQIKGNPVCLASLRRNDQGFYYITGHRITDKQEILNCHVWPSTNYQRGDATFHHWRSNDNQRHGLTFHHLGDAKKFERLIRQIIQEISPPRGSQSEEEDIFVQSDSLLLDCDSPPFQQQLHYDNVPRRPHKPKRLTEEYRSASMENSPEDTSSTDRDSPTGAKNNSANNSTGSLASNSMIKSSSHIQLDTDRKNRPSSTVLPTDPVIPPRAIPTTTTTTTPRTVTPPSVSSRSAYTDYRNDCYGKQKAQHTSGSKTKLSDIILDSSEANKTDMLASADPKLDLVPPVNTPKLPRKKRNRRHRSQSLLCCFKAPSLSDEYG